MQRVIAEAQADQRKRTIREWRREVYCESAEDFAARIGVASSTIYHWEAGEWAPSLESRRKVAEALGVNPQQIRWLDTPLAVGLPDPAPDAPRRTLREWRATFGESQAAFAARIGMSPQVIAAWEQGRKTPPRNTRYRIARLLDIHPAQILWNTPEAPSAC